MVRKLLTVEDLFASKSKGIILLPDVKLQPGERLTPGTQIMLRKPDGTILFQKIYGVGGACSKTKGYMTMISISDIQKEDIPIGTEVWTVD